MSLENAAQLTAAPRTEAVPKRSPPARRFSLHDVWARWAVRVATTGDPWAKHVAEFYRRLAHQETHHEP